MSDFIKTSELSREELEYVYERISLDYQKETQENALLKKNIIHFRNEIARLEKLILHYKNENRSKINHCRN
jgi:hypothetical protein